MAVALTEDTDEERLDAVDPLRAIFLGVGSFAVGILGRHALATSLSCA